MINFTPEAIRADIVKIQSPSSPFTEEHIDEFNSYALYSKVDNPSLALVIHWLARKRYGKQKTTLDELWLLHNASHYRALITSVLETLHLPTEWVVCPTCQQEHPVAIAYSPNMKLYGDSVPHNECRACVFNNHEKYQEYNHRRGRELTETIVKNSKKKREEDPVYAATHNANVRKSHKAKALLQGRTPKTRTRKSSK